MPFNSAQEAYDEYKRTGQYANSAKHFGGDQAMFGEYKHMIPHEDLQAFRSKVAGNENRAIEGMSQGLSREQMGIFNRPEEGQALYRRLGMGLGTGLDMNKAYDWGGGSAREVGTTDMAKYGTSRGITGTERQRWNDFQAAGSPEAYFRNYRGQQINGLLNSGAIERDPTTGGYRNPGGGGQYGANLEGYNLGQNTMGVGRGRDWRDGGGYDPASFSGGQARQSAQPLGGLASYGQGQQAPQAPPPPQNFNYGGGGGGSSMSGGYAPSNIVSMAGGHGATGGGGVQAPQVSAYGGGGAQSYGAPGMSYGAPQAGAAPQGGNTIYERPPGQVGPFGAPGTGNPSGNSLFPSLSTPGSGGPMDPSNTGAAGGGQVPGWRPEEMLPGVGVSQSGLPPGMGGFQGYEQTPYGGLLNQMGAGDRNIQDFNLMRAMNEYNGSQGYENALAQRYGDVLGYDFQTGQPLQGQAADTANANTFGMLAPEVGRIMGDTDALQQRLKRDVPEGGEKTAALGELYRGAAGQVGGLRQGLASEAVQGVGNLMQMKKAFDPGAYTGGAEALLGAYSQGRGQDIGAYGQSLDALLQGRGQDVQWGLGQGNLGLGYAGLGQQGQQNAWNNYLTGRGQDMDLYSGTRGQDLQRLLAQQQAQTDKRGQNAGVIGGLFGGLGTIIAA